MNEDILHKSIEISDIELIRKMITISGEKLCLFFNIDPNKTKELVNNLVIESKLSGHNNKIYLINFYDNQQVQIGKICLKYSAENINKNRLKVESNILSMLNSNAILCPKLIDVVSDDDKSFILMEVIDGESASESVLDVKTSEIILDTIQSHELVLGNNLETLQLVDENLNLDKEIDYEKKLLGFLQKFIPNLIIKNSLGFINTFLNDSTVIKKSFVTDRSADNIFIGENNGIIMVDFSTVRIGTQFDNWIQFIEDPKGKFSCSQEELIQLFFKKNNLEEKELKFFYSASIYTNLLQGIFTYKKNPQLAMEYFRKVNYSYIKLTGENNILVDTSALI